MVTINSSKVLVSVIIPTYNIDLHIQECLKSLEKQTLPKNMFEVIIVDDCSTDDTLKKARDYKTELKLQVTLLAENLGPGIARNEGLERAQGKYILFLDGDDFLVSDGLERLSGYMRGDECDLITFNWTYFSDLDDRSALVPRRRDLKDMPVEREALISHYLGMNMDGSVIYTTAKKSLFEQYAIRFPGGFHEDMSLIFMLYFAAEKILKLDEIIYIKQDLAGSIVNTLSGKHVECYLNAWPIIYQFLTDQGVEVTKYMADYYRGMSGHVCTVISKNLIINQSDFSSRISIYKFILETLEKDIRLGRPYSKYFPRVTDKDWVSQLFFAHMSETKGSLEERARQFEHEYFNWRASQGMGSDAKTSVIS